MAILLMLSAFSLVVMAEDQKPAKNKNEDVVIIPQIIGSDGLCIPSMCGCGLLLTYMLPGQKEIQKLDVFKDGKIKGKPGMSYGFLILLNSPEQQECARGFRIGEKYKGLDGKERIATDTGEPFTINAGEVYGNFIEDYKAKYGMSPVPVKLLFGFEAYPRAKIEGGTDTRWYTRGGSSLHLVAVWQENGKASFPSGREIHAIAVFDSRADGTLFYAGEAVDREGNRIIPGQYIMWPTYDSSGGFNYGNYGQGLGIYYSPEAGLCTAHRFSGTHLSYLERATCQRESAWRRDGNPTRFYPMQAFEPEFESITDPVCVDFMNGIDIPPEKIKKWVHGPGWNGWKTEGAVALTSKQSKSGNSALALKDQGKATFNMSGRVQDNISIEVSWLNEPQKGYSANGSYVELEFASGSSIVVEASDDQKIAVKQMTMSGNSRSSNEKSIAPVSFKQGWNKLVCRCDENGRNLSISFNGEIIAAGKSQLQIPLEGGIKTFILGKNECRTKGQTAVFDDLAIKFNPLCFEDFEYLSTAELTDTGCWKISAPNKAELTSAQKHKGNTSLLLSGSGTVTRNIPVLVNHTFRIGWFFEPGGKGEGSFTELRGNGLDDRVRFSINDQGRLIYQIGNNSPKLSTTVFTSIWKGWNEFTIISDTRSNLCANLNGKWVNDENGKPLLIPNTKNFDSLTLGADEKDGKNVAYFDDFRMIRNSEKIVAPYVCFCSTFEIPLDADEYFASHKLKITGNVQLSSDDSASGRRSLAIPSSGLISRDFKDIDKDFTLSAAWLYDPGGNGDAEGYIKLQDSKGKLIELGRNSEGYIRYRLNSESWVPTETKLGKGWNMVIIEIHLDSDFALYHFDGTNYDRSLRTFKPKQVARGALKVDGLKTMSIGRNPDNGSKALFLIDDIAIWSKEIGGALGKYSWPAGCLSGADKKGR